MGESELKGEKRSVDRRKGYKEHCSAFPWIWPELGSVKIKMGHICVLMLCALLFG